MHILAQPGPQLCIYVFPDTCNAAAYSFFMAYTWYMQYMFILCNNLLDFTDGPCRVVTSLSLVDNGSVNHTDLSQGIYESRVGWQRLRVRKDNETFHFHESYFETFVASYYLPLLQVQVESLLTIINTISFCSTYRIRVPQLHNQHGAGSLLTIDRTLIMVNQTTTMVFCCHGLRLT